MSTVRAPSSRLEAHREFYQRSLVVLNEARIRYLVGGAFALEAYTGIARETKDLDLFLRQEDCPAALAALGRAGYATEVRFPHWLAKARNGDDCVDLIYASGNGACPVDDEWFIHAAPGEVLGMPVWLNPPEEMLWSKSYVMERDRFDGADIAHLLRACGPALDWRRLLRRFGEHWRVLLSHLVLFGFIYPCEHEKVPRWVMRELTERLEHDVSAKPMDERVCQGTFLSWCQYLVDIEQDGYRDARHPPAGPLTPEDTSLMTDTLIKEQPNAIKPSRTSTEETERRSR